MDIHSWSPVRKNWQDGDIEERAGLDVPDLLSMFERTRGEALTDDALLLG